MRLTRIESEGFSSSSLESIEMPQAVRFVDDSAFINSELYSVSIEAGHD
jgi:hypothetical protein